METFIITFTSILAAGMAYAGWQMFHVKLYHPYEGRHHEGHSNQVPRTYTPVKLRYPEMWRARIEGTAKALVVHKDRLGECYQAYLIRRLGNYGWSNVPTSDWPTAWRKVTP